LVAALTTLAHSATAADVLEEVVVTAQKRAENIQDVPLTVSAVSEDSISRLGMQSFREWADYVPGITMSYGLNSRRAGPAAVIRGVASQIRGGIGDNTANTTSAFTIGEIPIFSVSPGLIDMNRIEVLKGPQGTLYGIAAMGGVVRYIPNDAQTDRFSAKVGVGTGLINHGDSVSNANAVFNIPLVEGVLAARFAAVYEHNGGFIDHIFPPLDVAQDLVLTQRPIDPRLNVNDQGSSSKGHYVQDTNKSTTRGGRLSLTYTPNEQVTIKAFTMWQKGTTEDSSQMDVNDPLDLVINRYVLQPQASEFKLSSLEASYDLGFGTVHYVGGYYENDLMETVDATRFVFVQSFTTPPPPYHPITDTFYPTAVTFPFATTSHQATHELRLQGEGKSLAGLHLFGSELKFDYVVGAFSQHEVRRGGYTISAPDWNANRGPGTPPIQTEGSLITGARGVGDYVNKAVFTDVTLHLTNKLSVGVGARRFDQHKDSDGQNFGVGGGRNGMAADDLSDPDFFPDGSSRGEPSRVENSGTTPRATLSYRIDDEKMLYFTAVSAERIGANAPSNSGVAPVIQPPECGQLLRDLGLYEAFTVGGTRSDKLWSYDLGLKSTWLDRRLLINASVYNIDWKDLQQAVILNSINRNCSQVVQANVGKANIRGLELESVYAPTERVKLNMTLAFADAQIDGSLPGVKDSIGEPLEDGDGIIGVPKWTGSFGAEYRFDVGQIPGLADDYQAYARIDWRYTGERINGFGDRDSLRRRIPFNVAEAYDLTDIRLGVENDKWSIQAYVSNLFDERAQFESLGNYFQPNIREIAVAQPRTVGINLSRQF
jgi:outer membrane receptor protein involved in Fe transport